ncbi:hypothetical protein [Bartonella sp. WD16.2]|uniref:hypothetical protein n=1 Tax=Bartonella sp. WD16.2 TaxID=1933904 RepID=UPI00099A7293|nr:hypothetical protein [Bartonella sp. WD16.2]AQX19412.1 hypothetical protein BWD162_002790 [Bartonella sp. WD16.2]
MIEKIFLFIMCLNIIGVDSVLAADCAEVGKRIASYQGGTLTRSTPIVQDGENMCVVVIVVPAHNGKRPRRVEVVIPAD